MSSGLRGKRVLFIAPVFYEYHREIIAEMRGLGALIDFFPERSYGIPFSVVNAASQTWLRKYQKRYYDRILRRCTQHSYDVLFVIRGFMMPVEFVSRIRDANPSAKTVLYQWDAVRNNDYRYLVDAFDTVCSFDRNDCREYPKLRYEPLFYTRSFDSSKERASAIKPDIDLLFIGGLHGDRYEVVSRVIDSSQENGLSHFIYLYSPVRSFLKAQICGKRYSSNLVRCHPMSAEMVASYMRRARCVLDIESPYQSGLTIRTFEVLAAGKKMATTNAAIVEEPCYDPGVISVVDRTKGVIDPTFVRNDKAARIDMSCYSLSRWLQRVLELG